ncbi:MAG TPA: SGNH/GDSL hydrolase family protein [Candidatus Dormibacteraeota bacterium]|nr:SGNH/GDSL hydrolase family protein [Candidatus Dormibacteraeota bacterium]
MNSARIRSHLLLGVLLAVLLGGSWHPAAAFLQPYAGASSSRPIPHPGHHQLGPVATPPGPPAPATAVAFEFPRAELPEAPDFASLAIPGRNGFYLVPYIQTQPNLHFRVRVQNLPDDSVVLVSLDPGNPGARVATAGAPIFDGDFTNVPLGDHRLVAEVYSALEPTNRWATLNRRSLLAVAQLTHVARGDIVAAIGDSTTEGNGGARFHFIANWVNARASAADWTSPDGRNFPQAGAFARPEAPASFTSTLGTILEQQRHHPVLVLNDGWSGATTQSYKDISSSHDLAAEYAAAQPNAWIVNLGVNDPIIHASAADFDANMRAVLHNLTSRYGARNEDIHVACPTYARDHRHEAEATYLPLIDKLRAEARLGAAPNFFSYYQGKPADLADEVHPNAGGYRDMAGLWAQALGGQGSACS